MKLTFHKLVIVLIAFVLGSSFCWVAAYLFSKETWPEYVTRVELMVKRRSFSPQGLGQIRDQTRTHMIERANLEALLTSTSVLAAAQTVSDDVDSDDLLEHLNVKTEPQSPIVTVEIDSLDEDLSKEILEQLVAKAGEIQVEERQLETADLVMKLKQKEKNLEGEVQAAHQAMFEYLSERKHVFFRPDSHQRLIAGLTDQYYADHLAIGRRISMLEAWLENHQVMEYLPSGVSEMLDREKLSIVQALSRAELDEAGARVQYGDESREVAEARTRKKMIQRQLEQFKQVQEKAVEFEIKLSKKRKQVLERRDGELEDYFWKTSLLHDPEYSRWNLKIGNLTRSYEECQSRRVELELYQGLIKPNFEIISPPMQVTGIDRKRISILLFASAMAGGFVFAVAALLVTKK